jgi:hypothetical protein
MDSRLHYFGIQKNKENILKISPITEFIKPYRRIQNNMFKEKALTGFPQKL